MPKNVLILTGGTSPQIVTETVWALAKRRSPAFIPQRIVICISGNVRGLYEREIVSDSGKLAQLCSELSLPPLHRCTQIVWPLSSVGTPIYDIRSAGDVAAYGDMIAAVVQRETADPDTLVHTSLAGGRKTMSFHAGAAMGLFGRPQDELSHVLVTPDVAAGDKDFWWPQTEGERQRRTSRDIELALIPFVRHREWLPEIVRSRKMQYASYVALAQATTQNMQLRLITSLRLVEIGSIFRIRLPNVEYALYQLMAEWAIHQYPGAGPLGVGADNFGWLTSQMFADPVGYCSLYKSVPNPVKRWIEIHEQTFAEGTARAESLQLTITATPTNKVQTTKNRQHQVETLSALRAALQKHLILPTLAERFGAQRQSFRPARFGLSLTSEEISVIQEP